MLDRQFKHSTYFKGANMTVKQFLDYVLSHYGDWTIRSKNTFQTDNLFETPEKVYYLTCYDNGRTRGRYTLSIEEIEYLSSRNDYFKKKIS